ncbi:MAG TPA: hypothetical protein VG502_17785 [Flexivirga sp.]|uniref:hypothetical protein n=1 Tax=Flexivirga sp. TaxID=1962927 RepID=UPI002C959C1E|nr:hypothetical protein [Flexivirga sp.]HWC24151.1 hypothetical protein [Flexivirga sp.]
MTTFRVVRYTTRPAETAKNEDLVRAVYDELAERAPEGFRYATLRLGDNTFVHLAVADGESPLPQLSAFRAFQADLASRIEGPPERDEAAVVGNYRLL